MVLKAASRALMQAQAMPKATPLPMLTLKK
jgi:hypothetical protein